ncbi:E3 ubiquitin/ISG15 ligase TRIM25-like [Gastrophryne carolinensis]
MASAGLKEELECSVCLSIYNDPVTLTCGHNYCQECICRVFDTQEGSGVYSCPECREEFPERPSLQRNVTICNVVENFLSVLPDQGCSVTLCTYCVDSPVPAVKSCLHCEVSLCKKHLRVHKTTLKHVLINPTTNLENRKHPALQETLAYTCTGHSSCLCFSCVTGDREKEMLYKVFEARKETLKYVLLEAIAKKNEVNTQIQNLQVRKRQAQKKAATATDRVAALFKDLRKQLDDLEGRILSEISLKGDEFLVPDLIKQLDLKNKLSTTICHIEELCNITDPLTFLQEPDIGAWCDLEEKEDNENWEGHEIQLHDQGNLVMTRISNTLYTGLSDIVSEVAGWIYILEPAEISLDVNTANNLLHISNDMKRADWGPYQLRPVTPERFQCCQVLSRESFSSGRHYWDVKIRRSIEWNVGMCYPSIDRIGDHSLIGDNTKSWSLERWKTCFSAIHDSKEIPLPIYSSSQRIRIVLDYEAGQISFYELCHPIRHLHTFTTTFTEPLHAVLGIWESGYAKISGRNSKKPTQTPTQTLETSQGDFTRKEGYYADED